METDGHLEGATALAPLTREQAEALAGEVVVLQAELDQICAVREKTVAGAVEAIRKSYESSLNEKSKLANEKATLVEKWVASHRDEVLPGWERPEGPRSFKTITATIGYRWTPARLIPAGKLTWDEVKQRIKALKQKAVTLVDGSKVSFKARFVRTVEEVDVRQLTADVTDNLLGIDEQKEIGVRLERDERFFIKAR